MKTLRWILTIAVLAATGFGVRAGLINGIKAVVHDSVVTHDEVNARAADGVRLLQRQYRGDADEFRKKLAALLDDNLEQLIERDLILRDFAQAGYNLPESIVDEAVQERIREQFGGDRATLTKTLQADGLTFEKFRQRLRDQIVVEILRAKNISQEVLISPHKIEKFYQDNRDKYKVEDEVKLRMIVLGKSGGADGASVRKRAEEILAKIKEGASFAEMASIYSQGSRPGGDWGWVEKPVLKRELSDVAFKLKPGEHSEVIDLPEACYLMLVEDVRPAHIRPLNEIREEIERNLLLQERARLQKLYIDKLRNKTFVRYF